MSYKFLNYQSLRKAYRDLSLYCQRVCELVGEEESVLQGALTRLLCDLAILQGFGAYVPGVLFKLPGPGFKPVDLGSSSLNH